MFKLAKEYKPQFPVEYALRKKNKAVMGGIFRNAVALPPEPRVPKIQPQRE